MNEILKNNLPLRVPMTIYIDPSNVCNFKCVMCPTGDDQLLKSVNRPKGMMSYEIFEKFVLDLREMVKKYKTKPNVIHLFKDGEPLLNKKLPEMIKLITKNNLSEEIAITTNASALTEEIGEKIIKSGLKKIRYSIYELDDTGYFKVIRNKITFSEIVENIKNFWNLKKKLNSDIEIVAKYLNANNSEEDEKQFKDIFKNITTDFHVEYLHGWSGNEKDFSLGKNTGKAIDGREIVPKKVCPQPFSRLTVLFNGDITPCCVDWGHKLVAGNLRKVSLDKLWNKDCNPLRNQHLSHNIKKDSPCISCSYLQGIKKNEVLDGAETELMKIYK